MSRMLRFLVVFAFVLAVLPVARSQATVPPPVEPPIPIPPGCAVGVQPSGADYLVCVPTTVPWNGDLVVFAHGYVDPAAGPFAWATQLFLPDGTTIPSLVTDLGYAFAASGYSRNGLAVKEGIADSAELVMLFKSQPQFAGTKNVFLVGVSEGGLITALSVEKLPHLYAGGVAACGPIGDFRAQINYLGDFRVLYDYFYPGVLPPTAVNIPPVLFDNWYTGFAPAVAATVANPANAATTAQLLRTANAPIDPKDPLSVISTTVGILDYNVRATEDAKLVLGGQPFGNKFRWYSGSANDWKLNKQVARFAADQAAVAEMAANYNTSGKLSRPLVSLHTTGDPIVPFWHTLMYRAKTFATHSVLKFVNIPVLRYGHCNFAAKEALAAFALMVYKATGQIPPSGLAALRSLPNQSEFELPAEEPLVPNDMDEGVYQP